DKIQSSKSQVFFLLATLVCGTTSIAGLASLTAQWIGPQTQEEYYRDVALHAAATQPSNSGMWIGFIVLLVVAALSFCAYKMLRKAHK
ncbi:hypothetical protein KKG16_00810, partial [Patescibacteria group bacterium]|nr:hypothetical protein [Patescibacteria group bacterium]